MTLFISIIAPALTVLSFVAQTQKIVRTGDTKSLSTPMWVLSIVAFAMWVAYGFASDAWPIIVPNIICGLLAAVILGAEAEAQMTVAEPVRSVAAPRPQEALAFEEADWPPRALAAQSGAHNLL